MCIGSFGLLHGWRLRVENEFFYVVHDSVFGFVCHVLIGFLLLICKLGVSINNLGGTKAPEVVFFESTMDVFLGPVVSVFCIAAKGIKDLLIVCMHGDCYRR